MRQKPRVTAFLFLFFFRILIVIFVVVIAIVIGVAVTAKSTLSYAILSEKSPCKKQPEHEN